MNKLIRILLAFLPMIVFTTASVVLFIHDHPWPASFFAGMAVITIPRIRC